MKTTKGLAALALGALLALASVGPVQATSTAKVGDFVVQLARAKNVDSADPRTAAEALAEVGLRLPADLALDKELTEGDVTRISHLLGLRVTTRRPEAAFDQGQIQRFFDSFGGDISSGPEGPDNDPPCVHPSGDCQNPGLGEGPGNGKGNGPPFDPFTKGQGKAKGKGKQPETPTEPY
jgi:hypothetical protein